MDWITIYSYLRMVTPPGVRLITLENEPGKGGGYIFLATDEVRWTKFVASVEFMYYAVPGEMKMVAEDFKEEWYRV